MKTRACRQLSSFGLQIDIFCDPLLKYIKVFCDAVLENIDFRLKILQLSTRSRQFFVMFAAMFVLTGCLKTIDQNVVTIETAQGPRVFHVEVADTEPEQNKGLMNRKSMPQDAGMLFVFGKEDDWSFWMKNTLIPLDLLFMSKDGTIHHIHRMARPLDETHIVAERPSKAVLEINGGLADTLGIAEGDKAIHPVFRNDFE